MVEELRAPDHGIQLQAVLVLMALSCSEKISGAIPAVGGIVALIPLLSSPFLEIQVPLLIRPSFNGRPNRVQINTVRVLSNLCSSVVCREGFYAAKGVSHLAPLLSWENEALCFESLRFLVILSVDTKIRAAAVACIPPLAAVLKHTQQAPLLEQAAFLTLCFCRDSVENRFFSSCC